MKKLIVAAFAVAFAAVAQAASVSWSASGIADAGTGKDAYAYCFFTSASDSSTLNVGTIDAVLNIIKAGNDPYDSGYEYGAYVSDGSILAPQTTMDGEWAQGTVLTCAMIIVDSDTISTATKYMVVEGETITIENTGSDYTASFGSQSSNTWQAIAAPEPTSGLLLLIGMAGLALRRRRA